MKSLRLRDLKKRSNKWFRNYGDIKVEKRYSEKQLEYFVRRTWESLPKNFREVLASEKERQIKKTVKALIADRDYAKWNVYESLMEQGKSAYRRSHRDSIDIIYRSFREESPSVYSKYNSYVYRLGYSSAHYFRENMDYIINGSRWEIWVDLPLKMSGTIYKQLLITYNWSGYGHGVIEKAEML